jgi:U4/U6.U5 tri-snRNP-associated protein 2
MANTDNLSEFKIRLHSRSLEGVQFTAGNVGLNDLKNTSFANVIIQLLSRVKPIRNHCLLEKTETEIGGKTPREVASLKLGELVRKLWNPVNFKGHVSPVEFIEAVSVASAGKFKCDIKSADAKFGG